MRPATRHRAALWLVLLWLAFVVRGFWYCALLPPWEGYDEPFHFAALQHLARGEGMPRSDTRISLEVQKSLHLLPVPWQLQFQAIPQPLTPYDDFWKLPAEEREQRVNAVRRLSPAEGSQDADEPILNYESQQTPLYYWLLAVPLRWMSGLSLLSRLYLVRLLSLLLASIVVPLSYMVAKPALSREAQALGATAILVLLPELMINLCRAGNEGPAMVCYTLMLAAALQAMRKPLSWSSWLVLGIALGCGLLSKAYLLSAVPGLFAVAVASLWFSDDTQTSPPKLIPIAARLATMFAIAFAIAGAWYLQVHIAMGSWTGIATDSAQRNLSLGGKLAAVAHVNWKSGFVSILVSHVWFGAWSFLRLQDKLYKLAFVVIAASIVGVVVRLPRSRTALEERLDVSVLSIFYLGFWAGLLYHVLVTYLTLGVSATAGWYLYAAVAAEVVLLVWGLQAFLPARLVFPFLAIAVGTVDLYATHSFLMPYYAGLASHLGNAVPASLGVTLSHLNVVFDRLALTRPAWLSAPVLLTGWSGYWVATLATVAAVAWLFRPAAAER